MSAYLSIFSMYNWDNSIFDKMRSYLPSYANRNTDIDMVQWPDLDFDVLIQNLLMETAELDTIYADPDFMKNAIGIWSAKQSRYWQEYYNTTIYKYNAIWNKDGTITRTETEDRNLKKVGSSTESNNTNGQQTSTGNTTGKTVNSQTESGSLKGTVTEKPNLTETTTEEIAGFNSTSLVTKGKSTTTNSGTNTTTTDNATTGKTDGEVTSSEEQQGSINVSQNGSVARNTNDTDTGTITRTYQDVEQGNIGVTMTQDMIVKQREVLVNIYDFIINDFKNRFCLLIY